MNWVTLDLSQGESWSHSTEAADVPGGVLVRSSHSENSLGDEGVPALSESMVFIPRVCISGDGERLVEDLR